MADLGEALLTGILGGVTGAASKASEMMAKEDAANSRVDEETRIAQLRSAIDVARTKQIEDYKRGLNKQDAADIQAKAEEIQTANDKTNIQKKLGAGADTSQLDSDTIGKIRGQGLGKQYGLLDVSDLDRAKVRSEAARATGNLDEAKSSDAYIGQMRQIESMNQNHSETMAQLKESQRKHDAEQARYDAQAKVADQKEQRKDLKLELDNYDKQINELYKMANDKMRMPNDRASALQQAQVLQNKKNRLLNGNQPTFVYQDGKMVLSGQ